jgi:hypothetical protein
MERRSERSSRIIPGSRERQLGLRPASQGAQEDEKELELVRMGVVYVHAGPSSAKKSRIPGVFSFLYGSTIRQKERPAGHGGRSRAASEKERVMSNHVCRRLIAALALLAILGTPLASAAGHRARPVQARVANAVPFAWLWDLLARTWAKAGCRIDPNGQCLPDSLETDNGCRIDPDGCLAKPLAMDEGCRIDPNGQCINGQ